MKSKDSISQDKKKEPFIFWFKIEQENLLLKFTDL